MEAVEPQEQKTANVITDRYAKALGRRRLDYGSYSLHLLDHRHEAIIGAAETALAKM